jgi:hypothetical protein
MKNSILFSFLFISLLILGCSKDDDPINEQETTNLNITFTANMGDEPFQMQKEYDFCDGRAIKFTTLDFFVSEIVLLKSNDPASPVTQITDVEFISLSFSDAAAAAAGKSITIQNVPVGNYIGVRFGLGVASDLNRTQPVDYGSSSPLSNSSFYWDGWSSYIFAKIEGFADKNNDGTITQGGADSEGFTYHTGTDAVYTEVNMAKPISLEKGTNGSLTLNVNVEDAFEMTNPIYDANNDNCLDIETYDGTHSDDQLEIAERIMFNLGQSFSISL